MNAPARKQRKITSDKVDPLKPASVVIDRFGGLTRFCEITGFPISTAHGWTLAGFIPTRQRDGQSYQAFILAKAVEHSIALGPEDFIEKIEPASPGPPHGEGAAVPGTTPCADRTAAQLGAGVDDQ